MRRRRRLALAAWAWALLGFPLAGQSSADTSGGDDLGRRIRFESGREMLIFPPGHLFPLAIADPHRPGSAVLGELYTSSEIEGAGDRRTLLKLGGRFGFFRWLSRRPRGRMWQLSLEAGLDAQFDIDNRLDNIGWDGNYGLSLTTARRGGRWAYLIGILHTSAHVGDEWIRRTGRERINYGREEARGAASWQFAPRWRTYLEAAWGYELRADNDLMDPMRGQLGLEYESPDSLWNGLAGWYVALDVQAWEERAWRLDTCLQTGLMFGSPDRTWRFGIQHHDGRVPLGEYFQHTESSVSIGLWSEL